MPTYRVTAPDGRMFDVTGNGTAEEAQAHVQQQYKAEPQQAVRDLSAGLKGGGMEDTFRAGSYLPKAEEIYSKMQPGGEYGRPLTGWEKYAQMVHGVGSGLNTLVGVSAGLPGTGYDLAEMGAQGIDRRIKGMSPIQYEAYRTNSPQQTLLPRNILPNVGEVLGGMEKIAPGSTTEGYKPTFGPARFAQNMASFGPALGPGAAYAAASEVTDNPVAQFGAALLAPSALRKTLAKIATPNAIKSAEEAALRAQNKAILEKAGIKLSAAQQTGSQRALRKEGMRGGRIGEEFFNRQGEDMTAAAFRTVDPSLGDVRRFTEETLGKIDRNFEKGFEDLGNRNVTVLDPQFHQKVGNVFRELQDKLHVSKRAPELDRIVASLANLPQGQPVSAALFQRARSYLADAARGATDPHEMHAYNGLREAIDDVMERSIKATNPKDLGAFRDIRGRYYNYLVLQKAAKYKSSRGGSISPNALDTAASTLAGKRYIKSTREIDKLAKAGAHMLQKPTSSGTAENLFARIGPGGLQMGLGGLYGASQGEGGWDTLSRAALYGIAGKTLGTIGRALELGPRARFSGVGRAYLGNQAFRKAATQPTALGKVGGGILRLTVGKRTP